MKRILITGGYGLIGIHLSRLLLQKGYDVAVLSRHKNDSRIVKTYTWDIDNRYIENGALDSADCIIHLAGTSIGDKRWSKSRKNQIIESRVKSTELLFEKVKELNPTLKVFISASGVGYYGAVTSDKIYTETDTAANDFLAETCRQWEQTADKFKNIGIRTVTMRMGVVLTAKGGILKRMAAPVKLGLGSPIGSGQQYVPWIHVDDVVRLYIMAIEDQDMTGVYNAVAPDFSTNRQIMQTIADVLGKHLRLPAVPTFFVRALFGEMASIVLEGSRVSCEKVLKAGFKFSFPSRKGALSDLLK